MRTGKPCGGELLEAEKQVGEIDEQEENTQETNQNEEEQVEGEGIQQQNEEIPQVEEQQHEGTRKSTRSRKPNSRYTNYDTTGVGDEYNPSIHFALSLLEPV
jgi:hypothetical protein